MTTKNGISPDDSEVRSATVGTGKTSEFLSQKNEEVSEGDGSYHSNSTISDEKEEVIMNISPKKFEKAKDQLFIDFFSMYTKRFAKD